ncbi:MAG: DNA adenine methylase [Bacillota bacterium]|nr:DNA adenine methylase [Bacillota bacterium]
MNYIGSKLSLLPFIEEVIEDLLPPLDRAPILCDMFTGTAAVAKHFKQKGFCVLANDIQHYSFITAKHFISNNRMIRFETLREQGVEPFEFLNALPGQDGFLYHNYSPSGTKNQEFVRLYFSDANAKKIDAVRIRIEEWMKQSLLTEQEYSYLIASLLESADRVANTASVYAAFLKRIKKTAEKDFVLTPLEVVLSERDCHAVFQKDANELIRKIRGDILYLDPPYNTRKYDTNYHILETIALYDDPQIKGKTGIRADGRKSKYTSKRGAKEALEDLIQHASFPYILLSYNDEGILSIDEIERIMSKYGSYSRRDKEYRRFKADRSGNRNHKKGSVVEYLHCLKKAP